jgi:hypothetical protein
MEPKAKQLKLELALAGVLLFLMGQGFAGEPIKVTKLRTGKVGLYDKPNGTKTADYLREQFSSPWTVTGVPKEGFIPVEVDGKPFWVKSFMVETSQAIAVNKECNVVVGKKEPKMAATRGIGEECKQ